MKKIILTFGLLSSLCTSAQLEKNTVFVGGFVLPRFGNFLHPFNIDNVYSRITPSAGVMLNNKWALGAEFNYQAYDLKSVHSYQSMYASAFARYYFVNDKKFAMYGNFSLGYFHADLHTTDLDKKYELIPLKIGFGSSYFLGKNLSLDMQANVVFNGMPHKPYLDAKLGIHYYIRPRKDTHKTNNPSGF